MPQKLRELARAANLNDFESRCLELLDSGNLPLAEVAECLSLIEQTGKAERVAPLAQMIFENIDVAAQPEALKVALPRLATPKSDQLRSSRSICIAASTARRPASTPFSNPRSDHRARARPRVLDFCLRSRSATRSSAHG